MKEAMIKSARKDKILYSELDFRPVQIITAHVITALMNIDQMKTAKLASFNWPFYNCVDIEQRVCNCETPCRC